MTARRKRASSSKTKASKKEAAKVVTSMQTRIRIKIIQAADRKVALDDMAQSEGFSFEEVLDCLDTLVQNKSHIDISYFVEEILDEDSMEEIFDYFDENGDEAIEAAQEDFGMAFSQEELRLARVLYRQSKYK